MRFMTAAALGLLAATTFLTPAPAQTPRDTVVMAKAIDDIISLDPGEAFEFSGVEAVANVYDKMINVDPADPNKLVPELAQLAQFAGGFRFFEHPASWRSMAWLIRTVQKRV